MSYLSVPRLHFFGEFLANPSTINNQASHYRTAPPSYPTFPPTVPANSQGVLWNPMGVAKFMLKGKNVNDTPLSGCTIQSVMPSHGALVDSAKQDVLVGASIQSSNEPATAKIVDLDPDQQLVTELFGLQLQLVFADGTSGFAMQEEEFLVVPNLTDFAGSGVFESAIAAEQIVWNPNASSPLFQQFQEACQEYGISVKFLLGNYNTDESSPKFTFGTIVGALGPALPEEPVRSSVGRKFIPTNQAFNAGYLQIDEARGKGVIDISNSTQFNFVAGKSPELRAAVTVGERTESFEPPLNYSQQQYQLTAGIVELDLTADQIASLNNNPLSIHNERDQVLSEWVATSPGDPPTGSYVTVSQLFLRLQFSEEMQVDLIARGFGQPLAGETFFINLVSGSASSGLAFPSSVTTDANGIAPIFVKAETPPLSGERAAIGSQLYYLSGPWQATSSLDWPVRKAFLTVKGYPDFPIPTNPTWDADVFPVMQHFMTLYPGMKQIHDLSDFAVVQELSQELRQVFSLPITDPRYMPVTRELNPARMEMVRQWIDAGMPKS